MVILLILFYLHNTYSSFLFMAKLKTPAGALIQLRKNHVFGRNPERVDSFVNDPLVSKTHATIQHEDGRWYLLDHSRNGTWLNGKRIPIYQEQEISPGDSISFANNKEVWQVAECDPPFDFLQHRSEPGTIIALGQMLFLPNEDNAELTLYMESNGQWILSRDNEEQPVSNKDIIQTNDGTQWTLNIDTVTCMTQCIEDNAFLFLNTALFDVNVSSDEEHVSIAVHFNNQVFKLKERIHHYLFLLLARKKYEDGSKGITPENRGWCDKKDLEKMLGVDYFYVNVQIHRLVKQLQGFTNANPYERQYGRIRVACNNFSIKKAGSEALKYKPN